MDELTIEELKLAVKMDLNHVVISWFSFSGVCDYCKRYWNAVTSVFKMGYDRCLKPFLKLFKILNGAYIFLLGQSALRYSS